MSKFQIISQALLNEVSQQAKQTPRLRKNYNLHLSDTAQCHRIVYAIEPGSYVPPHRHLDSNKDETMLVLAGSLGLIIFDDYGNVTDTVVLALQSDYKGVNLIHGCYHSIIALETNTVFFESKAGPYMPVTEAEMAPWAPAENTPAAQAYQIRLQELFR